MTEIFMQGENNSAGAGFGHFGRREAGCGIVLKSIEGFGESHTLQTSREEMQLQPGRVGINILTRAGWRD